MQPILTILEMDRTLGTMGFSYLERPFGTGGTPRRMTALYLRDQEGYLDKVVILPADAVRGAY